MSLPNLQQKILVIDDEPSNIQLLNETLKDDYRVLFALNGEESIKVANKHKPDLILLDIMMPDMNGYQVCHKLKSDKNLAQIPIFFITSMSNIEDETEGLEMGADDYIRKPINPALVKTRIKSRLKIKENETKTRLLNQQLERNLEGQKILHSLMVSAMEPVPLQDQLDQALTMIFSLPWLPVEPTAAIYLRNNDTQDYILQSYKTNHEHTFLTKKTISKSKCLCGLTAATKTTIHLHKANDEYTNERVCTGMEDYVSCCIPIVEQKRLLGIINLFIKQEVEIKQEIINFLNSIASILAIVIARKQLDLQLKESLQEQKTANYKLTISNQKLDKANSFIRNTFGRYISDEVVNTLLDSPDGLRLGGERKDVTVMMADLRGFTALSQKLSPEEVISLLNRYLKAMTEVILNYNGTIIEFLGDGILILFGAPITRDDDPHRAIACAIEMQQTMQIINRQNQSLGFPNLYMGVGINTGLVIAGNIGSEKRSKYGVVGTTINLTARIESLTVGGQILISEDTKNACGSLLRIDSEFSAHPKGEKHPITIYQVGGIRGKFNVELPQPIATQYIPIDPGLNVHLSILSDKNIGDLDIPGKITKLSHDGAEIFTDFGFSYLKNVKITLLQGGIEVTKEIFAKVTGIKPNKINVTFTSLPEEANVIFKNILEKTNSAVNNY
ncbi:MAG: response regulator [Magnetococcales bacterium]|nr:response regulator [Magnetococcales bacterium]